jgi:hypothetical protein
LWSGLRRCKRHYARHTTAFALVPRRGCSRSGAAKVEARPSTLQFRVTSARQRSRPQRRARGMGATTLAHARGCCCHLWLCVFVPVNAQQGGGCAPNKLSRYHHTAEMWYTLHYPHTPKATVNAVSSKGQNVGLPPYQLPTPRRNRPAVLLFDFTCAACVTWGCALDVITAPSPSHLSHTLRSQATRRRHHTSRLCYVHDAQSGSILVPVPACGPCVGSGSAAVASIESSDLLGVGEVSFCPRAIT